MGYEAKKTEHCGPKRGNGAYWGYRWDAKKESNHVRRENWKREIRDAVRHVANEADAWTSAEQTLNGHRTNPGQKPDKTWTKTGGGRPAAPSQNVSRQA
jgi:hypothetical protein